MTATLNVLLATDGSDSAMHAQNLVDSIAWPDPTTIRVLHVAPTIATDFDPERRYAATEERLRDSISNTLLTTTRSLRGSGRVVEIVVVVGRPASMIVDQAHAMAADLLVLGSRGRGAVTAALLGSVVAETVDHAPCPVLVARSERIDAVVLAQDGSVGAQRAEAVLVTMPFLRSLLIRVVSAWNISPTFLAGDPVGGAVMSADLYTEMLDDAREYATSVAASAVARLKASGRTALTTVLEATPVEAVAAAAGPTDLIVMGTRGHTGLARLFLGSVARGVLHRATSSVLIVPTAGDRKNREDATSEHHDPALAHS
jgi:nucleotide-binding universal stress UspA family protein